MNNCYTSRVLDNLENSQFQHREAKLQPVNRQIRSMIFIAADHHSSINVPIRNRGWGRKIICAILSYTYKAAFGVIPQFVPVYNVTIRNEVTDLNLLRRVWNEKAPITRLEVEPHLVLLFSSSTTFHGRLR